MKKLLLATVLLATSAFAHRYPSVNDSWARIKNHLNVEVSMPTIKMTHGPRTSVDFICIDGDSFRTKKPITKCVKWSRGTRDRDPECIKRTKFFGKAKFVQSYRKCVEWRRRGGDRDDVCTRYETVSYEAPTTYDVDVYALVGNRDNERRGRKLFTKELTVPYCN